MNRLIAARAPVVALLLATTAALLPPTSATATPVTLECRDQAGNEVAHWTLDLDKRTLSVDAWPYEITAVTDIYIMGLLRDLTVGGQVVVLDRATGEYRRALVSTSCNGETCGSTILAQSLSTGTCRKAPGGRELRAHDRDAPPA